MAAKVKSNVMNLSFIKARILLDCRCSEGKHTCLEEKSQKKARRSGLMRNTCFESGAALSYEGQQRLCDLKSAVHATGQCAIDVVFACDTQ